MIKPGDESETLNEFTIVVFSDTVDYESDTISGGKIPNSVIECATTNPFVHCIYCWDGVPQVRKLSYA